MWFDPTAIVQPSQPLATFATLATFAQNTVNGAPRVAEIAEVATPPYRWLIHFADRNPLEVAFSPALSHAEVLASYPDALAAEPFEEDHHESF